MSVGELSHPPHSAHVRIGEYALQMCQVTQLVFVLELAGLLTTCVFFGQVPVLR